MTTIPSTPATRQATWLHTLGEHLAEYPHLPTVEIAEGHPAAWLMIGPSNKLTGAHGALLWAKTMTDPVVELNHNKGFVAVNVYGSIAGYRVKAWSADRGDIHRWAGPRSNTPITLEQLAAYVAAGTVEGVTA